MVELEQIHLTDVKRSQTHNIAGGFHLFGSFCGAGDLFQKAGPAGDPLRVRLGKTDHLDPGPRPGVEPAVPFAEPRGEGPGCAG